MFPVGALSPTTGMRVVRVLTFDDWDPQTNLTQIRIAGLVENKALAGLDRVPVAIAYECPRCSLSMWEAHSLLPLWVQQELDEVLLLMRIGAYSSMAIICRRFVERITREHGAAGRGLKVRLEDLIRRKVLSGATLLWMEGARELGNVSAHSESVNMVDDINQSIVLLALALAQALYLDSPMESEDEHGIWTTWWEKR
jgi:hypothetical protein